MRALTLFPTPSLNLRLLEEVLYDLPPLEGVFLHWHTHGVTATTAGMYFASRPAQAVAWPDHVVRSQHSIAL